MSDTLCREQLRDAYRQRWSPWGSNWLRTPIIARVGDVHILLQRGRSREMIGMTMMENIWNEAANQTKSNIPCDKLEIIRQIIYLVTVATVSVATGYGEIVYGKGAGARSYSRDDTLLGCGRRGKKTTKRQEIRK